MEITHKNETIRLDEQTGEWLVITDAYRYGNTDLNKVRGYIDAQLKKGFERYDAYLVSWGKIKQVTVTSIQDSGDVWYVHNGDRCKLNGRYNTKSLHPINPQTEAIFNEYTAKMVEVSKASAIQTALQQEATAIAAKLTEATDA